MADAIEPVAALLAHRRFPHFTTGNGLHAQAGRLISVTLVLVDKLHNLPPDMRPLDTLTSGITNGVPIVHQSDWPNNNQFMDEPHELQVMLGHNSLLMHWGPYAEPARCIRSGRTLFHIDKHDLLYAVQIVYLSDKEILSIRQMYTQVEN